MTATKRAAAVEWTEVVEAFVSPDREQGGFFYQVYNAREEQVTNMKTDAVGERAALLEVTNDMRERGYEPVGRWVPDGDDERAGSRKFKVAK